MARQLIEAIRNGDTLQAKSILLGEKYGCIDCQTAKRDGTALFWACAKGFVELVQLLISKGASVNARTNYNSTPLIAAADRNRYQVMRLLIQQGADVNAQTSKGDTACHLAAYRGHLEAIKVLLGAGADVDITNTHFRTPYDDAIREGHFDVLPLLEGSEKLAGVEMKPATPSMAKASSLYHQNHQNHYHHPAQHSHPPKASSDGARTPVLPAVPTALPRVQARRDSCDCLSNQSLSRESSYEDCGGQASMNAVDWDDRLRSRDLPDFITAEILADAAANTNAGIATTAAATAAAVVAPASPNAAVPTVCNSAVCNSSIVTTNPASLILSASGYPSAFSVSPQHHLSPHHHPSPHSPNSYALNHHHHHPYRYGGVAYGTASTVSSSSMSSFLAGEGDAHLAAQTASGGGLVASSSSSAGRLGTGSGHLGDGALQRLSSFSDLVEDSDSYPHYQHLHHHDYHHHHHCNSGSSLSSFEIVGGGGGGGGGMNDLSSLAASSIPYGSYNDTASNDLSFVSDRPASRKSLVSRMNIPA